MNLQEKIFSHIQPYNSCLNNRNTMYDKQKYHKDCELCNADSIKLNSGNLYKGYSVIYKKAEPFPINTQDETTMNKLELLQTRNLEQ